MKKVIVFLCGCNDLLSDEWLEANNCGKRFDGKLFRVEDVDNKDYFFKGFETDEDLRVIDEEAEKKLKELGLDLEEVYNSDYPELQKLFVNDYELWLEVDEIISDLPYIKGCDIGEGISIYPFEKIKNLKNKYFLVDYEFNRVITRDDFYYEGLCYDNGRKCCRVDEYYEIEVEKEEKIDDNVYLYITKDNKQFKVYNDESI